MDRRRHTRRRRRRHRRCETPLGIGGPCNSARDPRRRCAKCQPHVKGQRGRMFKNDAFRVVRNFRKSISARVRSTLRKWIFPRLSGANGSSLWPRGCRLSAYQPTCPSNDHAHTAEKGRLSGKYETYHVSSSRQARAAPAGHTAEERSAQAHHFVTTRWTEQSRWRLSLHRWYPGCKQQDHRVPRELFARLSSLPRP